MANLIRVKQLDQPDLSGFFNDAFINTGILDATFVDKFTDQNISGIKTFIDGVNLNNIDNLSLSGVDISIISGNIALTNRPTVNGTGVLLSGEAASLPATIVYTSGNQTINGVKTFINRINFSGGGYISGYGIDGGLGGEGGLLITSPALGGSTDIDIIQGQGSIKLRNDYYININHGSDINLTTSKSSINLRDFEGDIYLNGITTAKTGTFQKLSATNLVYNTGDQIISGVKTFVDGINLNNLQNLILSGLDITITSGDITLTNRPTVNGTGVLLSGEILNLPTTIVYTTGDQTISGVKTFNLQPILSGNPLITGVDLSSYATTTNLANTGSTLVNRINSLSGSSVLTYGNQNISGIKTFFDSGIFSNGGASAVPILNNPLSVVGSGNSYMQLNIQNRATGLFASADLVITANNGTDSSNFINLGINNVGYNDPSFTNGTGLDGYLFIDGGNLDIGTRTSGRAIEFHAGGTTAGSTIARISQSGLNVVSGNLTVNNTGVLLSGQNSFTFVLTHSSSTLGSGFNYFGLNDAGYSSASAGSRRRMPILETCEIRKASWSHLVGTVGSPATILSTGYIINTSSNPRQTGIVSTVIDSANDTNPGHYITNFSPSISVISGDLIVAALAITGFTTAPLQVRDTVVLYCYN